ncbi:unnamed protein product [Didymodactylos carnosus]|uniref:G-protein coupled receptors family 1 profile domain-containing protein n=1 Tax=Didymodactylos carnosus TaxID=1234261 RepID=A0A814JX37_9BILA|nr:unnamed protein product [Didymodactylos carnosus]CAF1312938.1 unnamed protein product [Didymodactylos carnosus]CAF3811653.1 unnamed protein product [Didymodactylos carnosus]CAF4121374.1 unnamed protein product [Didymodactylos carnosus]
MNERNRINSLNETVNDYSSYSFDRLSFDNYDDIDAQQFTAVFQQIFLKIINAVNETQQQSSSSSLSTFDSNLAIIAFLPSTFNNTLSPLWSKISLWCVLIINPILIIFGVLGNIFATYILIRYNIVKLPINVYTVMLNISDTLNLLIPVFIFWLDNCINRKDDKGYFRDKSNFLCKVLMCPDQMFAALSAWCMCIISFNRWRSVCRPSSFYMNNNNNNNNNNIHKKKSFRYLLFCILHHRNLKAFRTVALITLILILLSCIPIFFHELRPVIPSDMQMFDLNREVEHTYLLIWKRCYYSYQHEHIYSIIGIILTIILHIIPLAFVAGANIMIIARLHHRQILSSSSVSYIVKNVIKENTDASNEQKPKLTIDIQHYASIISLPLPRRQQQFLPPFLRKRATFSHITTGHTITDKKLPSSSIDNGKYIINKPQEKRLSSRHCSRDRTITIMLVSLAISYLVLTVPYRLLWIWNVWIKHAHPELLSSSNYAWKMHYIDHFLKTIRNIHFATNFIFFIFLSKTFRQKFRQLFINQFKKVVNNQQTNNNNTVVCKNRAEQHRIIIINEQSPLIK